MSPDDDLNAAEADALAATLAVAKALCSLLELVEPLVHRLARDDMRYRTLARQVRIALVRVGARHSASAMS